MSNTKQIAIAWCRGIRTVFDDQNSLTAYLVKNAGRRVTLRLSPANEADMSWRPEDEPTSPRDRIAMLRKSQDRTHDAELVAVALLSAVEDVATDIDIETPGFNRGYDLWWTVGNMRHSAFVESDGRVSSYRVEVIP